MCRRPGPHTSPMLGLHTGGEVRETSKPIVDRDDSKLPHKHTECLGMYNSANGRTDSYRSTGVAVVSWSWEQVPQTITYHRNVSFNVCVGKRHHIPRLLGYLYISLEPVFCI
ncbi:hypothetical protein J6590_018231 [Homalodisca vitripennis]|nr:hypothetical protein J6590_018231 [Homalodisca vitripennis]